MDTNLIPSPHPLAGTKAFEIKEKLLFLDEALTQKLPTIATILRDIHSSLKDDIDTVTLLTEEDCSILVRGLSHQTSTTIATSALKAAPKKAMSKLSVSDL